MRLGTCIALELAMAVGGVAGVWVGVSAAIERGGTIMDVRPAEASAVSARAPRPSLDLLPAPSLPSTRAPDDLALALPADNVFGAPDAILLADVGVGGVTRVKTNHGGTSLSLRLDFGSGARAAFKPEQIHLHSNPRREIAAYRIDRLLGIGHVQPAKAFTVPLEELLTAADPAQRGLIKRRLADEAIVRKGLVHGELSWWIPQIKNAKLDGVMVDVPEGRTAWSKLLKAGKPIPEDKRAMLAQLSAMLLFDVLIDNPDRWSGGNTMMSPDGGILYFMDNALSFSKYEFGHEHNLIAMRRISIFPRALVERMRALSVESVANALATAPDDPLGPLVSEAEIAALLTRRDNLMAHIDSLVAKFGEDAVLALP